MKIEKFKLFLYPAILTLLITASATAGTTIIGETNPAIDVPAVQEAVDKGGIVFLKGIFDFGTAGMTTINNDVIIIGINATIYNGLGFLIDAPGYDVTIRGFDDSNRLTFVEPSFAAILVRSCESLKVRNVNVDGVLDFLTPFGKQKYGIFAECWWWWSGVGNLTPLLIGNLLIAGCNIDLGDYDADDTAHAKGIAIFGVGTPDNEVSILIKNNSVINCSRHGMGLHDIAGSYAVSGNYIRPGNKAANYMDTGANGIWTNQQTPFEFDLPGGVKYYQPDWARLIIRNNDIYCEPNTFKNGAKAVGIIAFHQKGTVIENNEIKVDDGYGCIDIFDGGDGYAINWNICSGSGLDWGVHLAASATNFKITGNDLSNAVPLLAQVGIESIANNNYVINNDLGPGGDSGGIYCNGYNNKFFFNTFHGYYPGWPDSGFVFLDEESHDNYVGALKQAEPTCGDDDDDDDDFDICAQVLDLGENNWIRGYAECLGDDDDDNN